MTLKLGDPVQCSALMIGVLRQTIQLARENARDADPDDECEIQCYLEDALEIIKMILEEAKEVKE